MDEVFNKESWNRIKGKLKEQYPILTNADLQLRDGVEEDFLRMIAHKLGKSRKELNEIITGLETL